MIAEVLPHDFLIEPGIVLVDLQVLQNLLLHDIVDGYQMEVTSIKSESIVLEISYNLN